MVEAKVRIAQPGGRTDGRALAGAAAAGAPARVASKRRQRRRQQPRKQERSNGGRQPRGERLVRRKVTGGGGAREWVGETAVLRCGVGVGEVSQRRAELVPPAETHGRDQACPFVLGLRMT